MNIIKGLKATYEETTLQGKIYFFLIYTGTCFSIIASIINIVLDLDPRTTLITMVTTIVLGSNIFYAYKRHTYEWPARMALLFMLVFIYPSLWITNSGLLGPTPYFFVFNTILVAVILKKKEFAGFLLLTLSLLIGLIIFEVQFPNRITPYQDVWSQKLDLTLSLFFIGIFLIIIVWRIMTEYEKNIQALHMVQHELHQLSVTDELTGIHNRRHILKQIDRTHQSDQLSPFSIMMFDIDDFKSVNDLYGHTVGDEVICGISSLLVSNIRPTDVAGRIGGEEFLVLLKDTNTSDALDRAEMIRTKIAQATWSKEKLKVTVSGGVYTRKPTDSPDHLLEQVDAGLYAAKNKGKNCIVSWQEASFM